MIYNNPIYRRSISKIACSLPVKTGRILITGAGGLIGSCMADVFQLANEQFGCSFEIYALGRNEKKLNDRFSSMGSVHTIVQNVMDPITVGGLDYIIHSASNADPESYALYPAETIMTNVLGAKSVLDYCKDNKSARVLLTSTFEVYGRLEQDTYSENDFGLIDVSSLRSCYPESKRSAELLFKAYHDEYSVDCVIARLCSIYGPTMLDNDSKAHAQFIRNALNGEDIVLKSKGDQKRTYCYVVDAVSALLTVLFNGEAGEAYNVANERSITTIADLAGVIAGLSNTKVVFEQPDDIEKKGFSKPQNIVLDAGKLKTLGWNGEYDLQNGIQETLEILKYERLSESR